MTSSFTRRIERRLRYALSRQQLQRDLHRIVDGAATRTAPHGPVIGIASLSSGPWHLAIEVLLAQALRLRGARPELLTCSLPDLPICDERTAESASVDRCAGCVADKRGLLDASGVPWRGIAEFVPADAIAVATGTVKAMADGRLRDHCERGWPIGEWLHVSGCHYLRRDACGNDVEQVDARRRLLVSAIVTVQAIERWLDELHPAVVIVESGAHFMWRIALELARARHIPVISREMGKGGWDHHIYALNADSMSPDLDAEWDEVRHRPLSDAQHAAVRDYLMRLPEHTYVGASTTTRRAIEHSGRPTIAAFTNVTWDLATAGRDAGFGGVFDWLCETLELAAAHPAIDVIVRVHPAEASVTTRERIADQLATRWPSLPPNVTLIAPDDPARAVDLFAAADLVSVYNSSVGIEAAAQGKPVIVSGRPHYRGRGFTQDVDSRQAYRRLVANWAAGAAIDAPPHAIDLAERYAYLFFLRYHIPMGWTTSPLEPPFELLVRSLSELAPGANAALDAVCAAILLGRQPLLPLTAERYAHP